MQFCQKNKIHMISDEVYALSVYDTGFAGPTFTSALSIDPNGLIENDRLHILYGMSKESRSIRSSKTKLTIRLGLRIGRSTPRESDNSKCCTEESSCSQLKIP